MRTATLIRRLSKNFQGDARLYCLSEPAEYGWGDDKGVTEYVVVSAVSVPFTGPETYIFPADAEGQILDWGEMDGSFRGAYDHERALGGLGYGVNHSETALVLED